MSGNSVELRDPSTDKVDKYTYSHAFWSHDNKNGHKIFTNADLFKIVGTRMLNNSYDGFNSTVFAYGQTGSGKSYSIEGSPEDKGLLQRVWESLFEKKSSMEDAKEGEIVINASYLEIYNENLKDLLDSKEKELKIFATKNGIIVKNLSKVFWESFEDILKLLEDGKKMRVVGATWMNKQSSRSHAVFTLFITLKESGAEGASKKIKNSEIHIVDLAGSERQAKTQATGERLKEGSSINKSLTYLGIVIEKLSSAKGGSTSHIPYRNSQLTYLLSESLGGNSKTIMIAAISPAAFNYDETTSTLKFAERVAWIQTTTKANVSEEENLRAALAAEIAKLKDELSELELGKTTITNFAKGIVEDDETKQERKKAKAEKKASLEAEIQRQKDMLKVADNDFDDARKEKVSLQNAREALFQEVGLSSSKLGEALNAEEGSPYLLNVSDDPTLAGWLVFFLKNGETCVGSSKDEEIEVDIIIKGLGMQPVHWFLSNEKHESVELTVEK